MAWSFSRKLSAVLVLAIHIVVIAAFLRASFQAETPPRRESEILMSLEQLPARPVKPVPSKRRGGVTGNAALPLPDFVNPAPSANALSLGLTLFGCNPENLRDLTREQQAKCMKLSGNAYAAASSGLPVYIKPKGPEWEGLRNSDLRARERNTADPCMAAKATGTECIHNIIYGKGLW